MSVLLISDFHFHGTPAKAWYDAIIDEIDKLGTPDVVVLAGDFLDSDEHFHWIREIIGRLKWNDKALAILGNHDVKFSPNEIRNELTNLGYTVVSNRWQTVTIRGVTAVVVGHEGPWFQPGPEIADAPKDLFRICVSHTPDYYYWARERGVNLMFCGHVHGGQVRLPILGSIFVPSWYSRRFDMGVFESKDIVMIVSRGLSGKEPLRFRCNPQVVSMKLVSNFACGVAGR